MKVLLAVVAAAALVALGGFWSFACVANLIGVAPGWARFHGVMNRRELTGLLLLALVVVAGLPYAAMGSPGYGGWVIAGTGVLGLLLLTNPYSATRDWWASHRAQGR